MISIILTILKIIGICILVIAGLLLLLIVLILFAPVRYRARGSYDDSGADITGRAGWLMAFVSFSYKSGERLCVKAGLFGVPLFDNLKERKIKKGKKGKKNKKGGSREEKKPQLKAASENTGTAHKKEKAKEPAERKDIEKQTLFKNTFEKMFLKVKKLYEKLINIFRKFKFTFQKIYATMKKLRDNTEYYWELLHRESTRQAFLLCKKRLLKIFKSLCPKKYGVKLHLGFDDPAVTGEALALWGMSYPLHCGRIDIMPEFERKIAEGSFWFKGRVRVIVCVRTVQLLMTDRNIRQLRSQLKI
ncbi:MAG: hypothetical protein LUE96_06970 [Lachnospiraceae bacterium]|nr:hypothetical protein [Lachnospiraceae bacterium]